MMMMVKAESAQERGLSAGMSEIAAAHGEAAETVRREMKAWPDMGTGFSGVPRRQRRTQSGNYGAQIRDPLPRNACLGTFGAAEDAAKAYGAAAVELHGAAAKINFKSPAAAAAVRSSASVTVVKEEMAEEHGDGVAGAERRKKRERTSEGGAAAGAWSGETMMYFEGLMKQAMERQKAMQHRFVETIEKPEQDNMIRDEAWRRQEMARLAREQEILAQEMATTLDASVPSFIQKITGQTIPMPSMPPSSCQTHATPIPYAAAALPWWQPPPLVVHRSITDIVMMPAETPQHASGYDVSGGGSGAASSSRSWWADAEVHALIQLRCDLEMRRTGPKGPLWEEISAGMRRMGYSRSSQRCREKWWNMYYYFKKVKASNKTRPEDSKTPRYFHQLEPFYRKKAALGSPANAGGAAAEHANAAPRDRIEALTVAAPMSQVAPQTHSVPPLSEYGGNGHGVGGFSGGMQMQASNMFVFSEAGGRAAAKKAIKLEGNVHSPVATDGTYMWNPAPIADDIDPEHVQEIGLKQAPVAAKANSNVDERRRAVARSDSLSGFRGVRPFGGKYYLAQIMEPGRPTRRLLGIFNNVDEATRAYDAAALRLYGYGTVAKTKFGDDGAGVIHGPPRRAAVGAEVEEFLKGFTHVVA